MGRATYLHPARVLTALLVLTAGGSVLAQNPPAVPAGTVAATHVAPTAQSTVAGPAEGTLVEVLFPGEIQLRYTAFTDIPLATLPGGTLPPNTGQNGYFEHWFRFRPTLRIGERVRVATEFDIARVVLTDQDAVGLGYTPEARNTSLPYGLADFRQAYLEWTSPAGVLRAGQQAFHWGYGILANDGNHAPVFGDYRYGDLVERLSFATRPAGHDSPVVLAVAADLVYRDRLASLTDGDRAWQGVLAAFWQDPGCRTDCERKRVGALAAWRDQTWADGSFLRVFVADLHARWEWPQPDRVGRVFAGLELAAVAGSTDVARTVTVPRQDVRELGAVGELGLERTGRYRLALEGGYTSGDSNPVDDQQRRFTFNPGYRVGLILFPEVLQWQSARSAALAADPSLVARAPHGVSQLPTWGGVAGAAYLYPSARIDLSSTLDLRAAMVIAMTTTDNVDPVSTTLQGAPRNHLGGDSARHDLGVEFDLGLGAHFPLSSSVTLQGGVQGAVLLPGHALDAAGAVAMKPLGLITARAGLAF